MSHSGTAPLEEAPTPGGMYSECSFQSSQLSAETAMQSCQVWVFLRPHQKLNPDQKTHFWFEFKHHWNAIRYPSPTDNRTFWEDRKCPPWDKLSEFIDKNPVSLGCTYLILCHCWRISSLLTSFKSSIFKWYFRCPQWGTEEQFQGCKHRTDTHTGLPYAPKVAVWLLAPLPGVIPTVAPTLLTKLLNETWMKIDPERPKSFGHSKYCKQGARSMLALPSFTPLGFQAEDWVWQPSSPLFPQKWKEKRNAGHSPHLCLWSWPGGP